MRGNERRSSKPVEIGLRGVPRKRRGPTRTSFAGVANACVTTKTFELTRAELTRLKWIAASLGMSATNVLRAWIREGRTPRAGEEIE